MDKIIERLREEKMQIEAEYFDYGVCAGEKWCEVADYQSMKIMMEWDGKSLPRYCYIEDLIYVTILEDDFMEFGDEEDELFFTFNDLAREYFDGFIESVNKIWRMI